MHTCLRTSVCTAHVAGSIASAPSERFKSSPNCDKFVNMQSSSSSPTNHNAETKWLNVEIFVNLVAFHEREK